MPSKANTRLRFTPLNPLAESLSLPPELKSLFGALGTHFWQFDATEIARMLSPSDAAPSSALVDAAYSLLKHDSLNWPEGAEDTAFHNPLVISLNDFLTASHLALDRSDPPIVDRDDRWYAKLRFMLLGDGSCATHGHDRGPVKREAVGGVSIANVGLAIPVKLDEDWPAVVAQAARSAHILYVTCTSRKYALVIGFRHTTLELRFLISHRGGLTVSKPLSVVGEEGKKGILRVFLSMLMWRDGHDAGFYPDQLG